MEECQSEKCQCSSPPSPDRRGFVKKFLAGVLGTLSILAPIGAGIAVLLDPLRRKANAEGLVVSVTKLSSLPEDGIPRKFPIVASRVDAWNRSAATRIGAIYLRREPGKPVRAYNVVCPHAGCFVDYAAAKNAYLCPCHNSTFDLDGKINDPKSPSPRGLDELTVEIRNENEVWVKFQNYRAGVAERIPA
jgi:menaquinol-cytochrome c reductase iron-sulfur subunit